MNKYTKWYKIRLKLSFLLLSFHFFVPIHSFIHKKQAPLKLTYSELLTPQTTYPIEKYTANITKQNFNPYRFCPLLIINLYIHHMLRQHKAHLELTKL